MKGLFLKDLLNLKKLGAIYLIMLLAYGVMAFFMENASFLGGMVTVIAALLPYTTLAYDEQAKWDRFALTMPIRRRDIVLSKYLLGILLALLATALNIVAQLAGPDSTPSSALADALLMFCFSVFLLSFMLPLAFRLGVEKGRLLIMLVIFIPAVAAMAFSDQLSQLSLSETQYLPLAALLTLGVLVLFAASLLLSIRIYQKKEL